MPIVDVTTEIDIAAPRERVAEWAADPDHVPLWYANIRSVEWKSPRPVEIGSRIAFVAHFLGRRLAYTYEVVEFARGERFVMRTSEGPFPMETTYAWQSLGADATRMSLRNRGAPAGFSAWIGPFLGWMVRRANRDDLRRLKTVLESSGDGAFAEPSGAEDRRPTPCP